MRETVKIGAKINERDKKNTKNQQNKKMVL
jgi:hypothetical protein